MRERKEHHFCSCEPLAATTTSFQVQEKERRTEITGLKYRKSQSQNRDGHLFFEALRQILFRL